MPPRSEEPAGREKSTADDYEVSEWKLSDTSVHGKSPTDDRSVLTRFLQGWSRRCFDGRSFAGGAEHGATMDKPRGQQTPLAQTVGGRQMM